MPAPSTCLITGVAYKPDGSVAPGARLTLLELVKNGVAISSGDEVFTADALGAFSFSLIRGSVATLRGGIEGFNGIHGATVTIPDAASATLESLVPAIISTPASALFNFIGLADAPSTYVGQGGLIPRVKTDESGLEFVSGGGGYTDADAQDAVASLFSTLAPYHWGYNPNISLALSIDPATTLDSGLMSALDKTKLDGIATGATANSSDATLLARANHTGVMPDSGFPATLPVASGANLTALNASNLSTGALAVARGGTGSAFFTVAGPTATRTFTFPDSNATIARTDATQTFTGTQRIDRIRDNALSGTDLNITNVGGGVGLGNGQFISWNSNADGSGKDTSLTRNAGGVVQVGTGSANASGQLIAERLGLGPAVGPAGIGAIAANGQALTIYSRTELLTIAAAATTTTTMLVPAGAIVLGVSVRVTTVIPTAATFTVKIGATTFNTAAVSTAATSTDPGTAAGAFYNATAGGVIITPNLTPGAATGVVRVTVAYILITPPTS